MESVSTWSNFLHFSCAGEVSRELFINSESVPVASRGTEDGAPHASAAPGDAQGASSFPQEQEKKPLSTKELMPEHLYA